MIPLERVPDGGPVGRNMDTLQRLVVDFGGVTLSARVGSVSVTWPGGSDTSNLVTDAHGFGSAPAFTFATANDGNAGRVGIVANSDGTNVSLRLQTVNGGTPANTVTTLVSWLVIG